MWSRFFPAYERLRQELSSGSIGDVKGLTAYFGLAYDRNKEPRMFDMELGGGMVKAIGVYPIQLACLVFNNEKPDKICVNGQVLGTGECHPCDVDVMYSLPSFVAIVGRFLCIL